LLMSTIRLLAVVACRATSVRSIFLSFFVSLLEGESHKRERETRTAEKLK
jgi:hypothetical protein